MLTNESWEASRSSSTSNEGIVPISCWSNWMIIIFIAYVNTIKDVERETCRSNKQTDWQIPAAVLQRAFARSLLLSGGVRKRPLSFNWSVHACETKSIDEIVSLSPVQSTSTRRCVFLQHVLFTPLLLRRSIGLSLTSNIQSDTRYSLVRKSISTC